MARRLDRAWMDVDLGALVRNARTAQTRAGVPLIPMIKADAYGLGAERVANALESLDPYGYGVATIAEAINAPSVVLRFGRPQRAPGGTGCMSGA